MLGLILLAKGVTDGELVRRFKSGDRDAFADIVDRYQHRVFTMCLRWMGDRGVAEEVAQDVFLALFRSLADFRGEASLSTWIYRVTVNHCKNKRMYQQRRARDRHEPLEGKNQDDGPERQIPHEGPGTDRGINRSEAEAVLNQALQQIDESQREILLLRDVEDLAYDEIAEILSLPKGTVKSRLHRARAELAKVLSRLVDRDDIF